MPSGQICLLVEPVRSALNLRPDDHLLDLCCGNGLVTNALSKHCGLVIGIDYAADLIEMAHRRSAAPNVTYLHGDAAQIVGAGLPSGLPHKVCMNQDLQYFTEVTLRDLLNSLRTARGGGDLAILFTDVPDATRLNNFYDTPERREDFRRRRAARNEAIGGWWSPDHLRTIFKDAGYALEVRPQDAARFAAHYRFDLMARLRHDEAA